MKKVFMLLVLLCCTLSGFAEEKPIKIREKERPKERIPHVLPTAYIDGQVLTINFSEATASQITVISQGTQVVVYNGSFTSDQIVINLPALSDGEYQLEIEQGGNLYYGDFNLELTNY